MNGLPDLRVKLGKLELKNPVLVASGTFGYGEEYAELIDLNKLGGIMTKAVTLRPKEGNPPPRLVEVPCGLLNAIGLENPGLEVFIREKLSFLRKFDTKIIVNIAGEKEDDYLQIAKRLSKENGVDALEVNISCPNVKEGGLSFGTDPKVIYLLVKRLKEVCGLPLILKLTPNVTDIKEVAKAAEEGGADILSLVNTVLAMAVDVDTQRPKLGNIVGGLSGPAIRPIAVRMVWEVSGAVNIPIIGMGGIMKAEDALEFVIAGASAVAVGTANFVDPRTPLKVIEGIGRYLKDKGIDSFASLVGSLKVQR
ncbi:dihydroorotate dehydrogenase [Candidatus Aerophobetes bacterium]|uniref:Dihydroorotate dehydrogenase n=1 Tax=Aerophobetes bacterium TaxID=2030807 RepID=A0A497E4J4_UNCAE|nr:MAG: dihydroorotate dehydrogenase [Candidatus Aerophobetes bacterium]